MKPHLMTAIQFIDEHISRSEGVLVHCQGGKSRSASMVLAYLISKQGMSFEDALELLKQKRKVVKPNDSFAAQLKEFEKDLKRI